MDSLLQDLRFSARTLLKSPGFAVISVLCVAIGIGANTTIFSVANAISRTTIWTKSCSRAPICRTPTSRRATRA